MMQAPRASRISEAEWNSQRQKLERLYLDDDLSRREVLETMAREENFHATEKQLKYQFSKWGLKKYVSDQDLTLMLSIKRKRQVLGKDTGFEYRGRLLEQERLERASKRRKGPLVSSPVLPPYITALVSPRRSPPIIYSPTPHPQTPTLSHGIEEATHNSRRQSSLEFSFNNSFHQSGDSDILGHLDIFSDSTFFHDGEQTQVNHGLEEVFFDASVLSLSARLQLPVPPQDGQGVPGTRTQESSPLVQQMSSIPSGAPDAQGVHENNFLFPDLDQDLDFSMFLSSSNRPSTAHSSSHGDDHHRRSVERISISSLQSMDHGNSQEESRGLSYVSTVASAADQSFDPVTGEDLRAESIASLLLLLKSLIFPPFDTTAQKCTYEDSVLSEAFCPSSREWLYFEIEELLGLYLEWSLRTVRKRRAARTRNTLPPGCNSYLNEHWQGSELLDRTRRLSKPTETTRTRFVDSRYFHTPMGQVLLEITPGPSNLTGEKILDSNQLITISFMPRAMQRTPGLCIRFFKMMEGPAVPPHINTFNVIPDDSEIIHCIFKNDLRGIQTLFDLGKASARDVDSRGLSLLQYAVFSGCCDILQLLIRGGASLYKCHNYDRGTTDIITSVWNLYAEAHLGCLEVLDFSLEKVKDFESYVAITRLALDADCVPHGADERVRAAGPDFGLVGMISSEERASTWVKPIAYLSSIGWDLEQRNDCGQTPLLYSATNCGPWFVERLRVLIRQGAKLDVKDSIGRGPLFSVLSGPTDDFNWVDLIDSVYCPYCDCDNHWALREMHCSYCCDHDCDNNWALRETFNTECHKYVRDPYDTEGIVDPHTNPTSPKTSKSKPSLNKFNRCQLETDHGCDVAAEAITDSEESSFVEMFVRSSEDEHYVWAVDCDGAAHWIRNPIYVLKDRARMALEVLLEAGCDPNELGPGGQSPSDYARRGLWPQWRWALEATGYIFDEGQSRCIKRINEY